MGDFLLSLILNMTARLSFCCASQWVNLSQYIKQGNCQFTFFCLGNYLPNWLPFVNKQLLNLLQMKKTNFCFHRYGACQHWYFHIIIFKKCFIKHEEVKFVYSWAYRSCRCMPLTIVLTYTCIINLKPYVSVRTMDPTKTNCMLW